MTRRALLRLGWSVVLALLLAVTGAGMTALLASAAPARGVAANSPTRLTPHIAKARPVVLRVSHNPTGHTIRGPALRGVATSNQTTGPIVVTFETASPCQTFPSEAQAAVQAAVDVWNV